MHTKVCTFTGILSLTQACVPFLVPGAKHLYLLDFVPENLPNLKSTIEKQYPDVKACLTTALMNTADLQPHRQVTTIQADAADEAAISAVCQRALKEEGRLDVFFANVLALCYTNLLKSNYPHRLELDTTTQCRTSPRRNS
jgi:NAD(P)-dependent dehydrogenase (short-subunit alcohol dehydrogenase family)